MNEESWDEEGEPEAKPAPLPRQGLRLSDIGPLGVDNYSMPLVPLVGLGTVVFSLVNVLKFASAKQWNSVVTQLIAWVAGIAGIFVVGATQFASGIAVGDLTLDKLDTPSKFFLGLVATSLLSTVNELKKAIDNNDSAATPPLIRAKTTATPVQQ